MSKDEIMDEELTGMVNFTDETVPAQMLRMEQKPKSRDKDVAVDAQYTPIPKARRGTIDRLKSMAKWLGICGGICMLLWWFQVNDLMAMQAAYPCIVVCGILGGFGVGKNTMK
ncbi:MAG: hypothetical protein IJZ56_03255 [Oscillospiraceae bacterium]|nr:hypothetical protein [Oscillospiraceae bacterium]